MKYLVLFHLLADTYSCGTYGSGNFNDACATGGLAATGTNIAIGIAVGVVLVAGAVILILRNRKKK